MEISVLGFFFGFVGESDKSVMVRLGDQKIETVSSFNNISDKM